MILDIDIFKQMSLKNNSPCIEERTNTLQRQKECFPTEIVWSVSSSS